MADDVGVLVARVVADTEQFRSEMLRVSNQLASNTAKMNSSLAKVQESTGSLTKQLEGMKTVLLQLGVAFSIGALVKFAKDTLDAAANLQHLSERLNVSVESLSELQYIAKITDVSFDSLTRSMSFMVKTIGEAERGTKAAVEVFGELGLNFQVLSKMTASEQLLAVAAALSRVDNEAERSALAVKVFSKSGQEMLQIVNQGPEALRKLIQEAHDLGGVMSGDTAKAAADAKDALDRLGFAAQGLANSALPALAHALEVVATGWNRILFGADPFPFQAQIDALIAKIKVMNVQFDASGGMTDEWKQKFLADMDEAIKKLAELKTAQEKALGLGAGGAGAKPGEPAGLQTTPAGFPSWDKHDADLFKADQAALDKSTVAQLAREMELQQSVRDEAQHTFDLEQGLQEELRAERQKSTDQMLENVVTEVEEYRQGAIQRREIAVETSAAIEYAAEALMQTSQGHNKKLFELSKKLAIASTIVNTAQAIMKGYAELGPIGGTIAAVVIATTGLLQLQRIRSTQFESAGGSISAGAGVSGSALSSSSGSTTASTDLQQHKNQALTVQFMGDVYGWDDYVQKMVVAGLRDAIDGKDVVIIGGNSRQAALLGAGG